MRCQRLNRRGEVAEELPNVNLTPLIDVVFVILIVFILVAPMLEIDSVNLAMGSAHEIVSQEAAVVAIHVGQDNGITFNHTAVTIERLGDLLREAYNRNPKARPQLFHDCKATFGTYQSVKTAVEAAGFEAMDVVLKPGNR